jgi:hypothetical protein
MFSQQDYLASRHARHAMSAKSVAACVLLGATVAAGVQTSSRGSEADSSPAVGAHRTGHSIALTTNDWAFINMTKGAKAIATPASTDGEGYELYSTGVAGDGEEWGVGGAQDQGVAACYAAVMASSTCQKDYFTYVERGDKNCGCRTSTRALSVRSDGNADLYKVLPPYEFLQTGVAAPGEKWGVGNAQNQGVASCYEAVMADSDCQKDYFTYVERGDKNCGCKTGTGALSARSDGNADLFQIS